MVSQFHLWLYYRPFYLHSLFVNSSFTQPCLVRGFFDQDCIKSNITA
ncbi:hypothetical protein VP120E341_P0094 [Vibrio phage 120E34-1]|nr:hypothetical protein VP120E341_P0094 [Vibrio phage 120E34-1]